MSTTENETTPTIVTPMSPLFDDPALAAAVAEFAKERGAVSLGDLFLLKEAVASDRLDKGDIGTYSLDDIEQVLR